MRFPRSGDRILMFVPHPDDETIACSSILDMARRREISLTVAFVTLGEGARDSALELFSKFDKESSIALGRIRHGEAERALDEWKVPKKRRVFLGFPDGHLADVLSDKCRHPFFDAVPWSGSPFNGRPFNSCELLGAFRKVCSSGDYDFVLSPHPLDHHPDHVAVAQALRSVRKDLVFYSVSNISSPKRDALWVATGMMRKVKITPGLRKRKAAGLACHKSQAKLFREVAFQLEIERYWQSSNSIRGKVASFIFPGLFP